MKRFLILMLLAAAFLGAGAQAQPVPYKLEWKTRPEIYPVTDKFKDEAAVYVHDRKIVEYI
ncbi:MAG TPA: hypothetical protein VHK69_15935, partial [Chitinophagaceae bacterium]|nr:hypothetical protein [Chitinophagaceae bacterium]